MPSVKKYVPWLLWQLEIQPYTQQYNLKRPILIQDSNGLPPPPPYKDRHPKPAPIQYIPPFPSKVEILNPAGQLASSIGTDAGSPSTSSVLKVIDPRHK